jgi:hypothetical protein
MTKADNPEEFEESWNSHIDTLTRLGWSLEEEDYEELKNLQEELKELVKKASDNQDFEGDN